MGTVTGYTAAHMQEIVDELIVSGHVTGDSLILVKNDGGSVNAGNVRGPQGTAGLNGAGHIICTSSTRPSLVSGDEGKTIYETDTNMVYIWNGAAWRLVTVVMPDAVGSGAEFSSWRDGTGETWVAKGGVATGAWQKARDVLYGRRGKTGAVSVNNAGWTAIGFDTQTYDAFGLWTAVNTVTAPIPGKYMVSANLTFNGSPLVAGTYGGLAIFKNGASFDENYTSFGGQYGTDVKLAGLMVPLALNDTLTIQARASVDGCTVGGATATRNFLEVSYMGTG